MNAENSLKLIVDQREILVQARTIEEKKLEEFAKNITSVNIKEVFGDIEIPNEISLRAFCPEAYEENPDPAKYTEQYDRMIKILTPINDRIREILKESAECIQQFKQMR